MSGIFISYRRGDKPHAARSLAYRLRQEFAESEVFMDIHSIGLGLDFKQKISQTLDQCQVMIALIGPNWDETDEQGRRRLEDPEDWIRQEIESALTRPGVRVIPLLVEGADLPSDLPAPSPTSRAWQAAQLVRALREASRPLARARAACSGSRPR